MKVIKNRDSNWKKKIYLDYGQNKQSLSLFRLILLIFCYLLQISILTFFLVFQILPQNILFSIHIDSHPLFYKFISNLEQAGFDLPGTKFIAINVTGPYKWAFHLPSTTQVLITWGCSYIYVTRWQRGRGRWRPLVRANTKAHPFY